MKALLQRFNRLGDGEKLAFFKEIMPDMCALFRNRSQQLTAEEMPLCCEMMQGCDFDLHQIFSEVNKSHRGC
jgi:hypothetical protein